MGSPKDKAPRRRLLTYDEAGEYLAVGRTTMYDLVARGELPTVKIRRCTRFKPERHQPVQPSPPPATLMLRIPPEAKVLTDAWRRHYNHRRPHSALGYRPPAPVVIKPKFAATS